MAKIEINVTSLPDRDRPVAEIFVDNIQLAEVHLERGAPEVELYPRPDGEPWRLPHAELTSLLEHAWQRLRSVEGQA